MGMNNATTTTAARKMTEAQTESAWKKTEKLVDRINAEGGSVQAFAMTAGSVALRLGEERYTVKLVGKSWQFTSMCPCYMAVNALIRAL